MASTDSGVQRRIATAITQCEEMIDWYADAGRWKGSLHRGFQTLIIVLSGTTPVLVLFTGLPKPVQALPAALAALAAAIAGSNHWYEDTVRYAAAREQLKSELRQFRVRGGAYTSGLSDEQALEAFVVKTEAVIMSELSKWQSQERSPSGSQK